MGLLFFLSACCLIATQQSNTQVYAAPPIEACPPDSILSENSCKCDPDSCIKPPCLSTLVVAVNGTDEPGSCCPIYDCVDCKNETLIDDRCPCVPNATLNEKGICECVDQEKHLVNGECVCNPQQCELPQLCDKKSVLVYYDDENGCCRKSKCIPCPEDSESTNYGSDLVEDKCVCLPCNNDCGSNKVVVVKNGTNTPGSCCDLYECKSQDGKNDKCIFGDLKYADGEVWFTHDNQECKCHHGLSLCSKIKEEKSEFCFTEDNLYRHNETWMKDDGCTNCTCVNGESKCISHYCEFKESKISQNETKPCYKENKLYQHLEQWFKDDGCTKCVCVNGEEKCNSSPCENKESATISECQPLVNCNRTCTNGFKLNKKGCEICKCHPMQDILHKYNISMNDFIKLLEDYKTQRTSNETNLSTTTTPAATTLTIVGRVSEVSTTTTTEPSIIPTNKQDPLLIVILTGLIVGIVLVVACTAICVYKSKRKHSIDLSHYQYKNVNTLNNNNTIRKTEPLL